jgi:hypothetical protein
MSAMAWAPDQQRTPDALRSIRGTRIDQNGFQKFNSFVRSRHSGFRFSIGSIFHARRQRLFSRAGFNDGIERFKIDKLVDVVFSRETGNKLGWVPALRCSAKRALHRVRDADTAAGRAFAPLRRSAKPPNWAQSLA